jgi:hypothetical protein
MNTQAYDSYLKSDHWKDTRARFYSSGLYKGRCECCWKRNKPLDIHHKSYRRIGKEKLNDLIALCRDCHFRLHDLVGTLHHGRPVRLWTAVKILRRKMIKNNPQVSPVMGWSD